ncbi:MAG: hypothetical protein HUK28_06530, partial [Methanobrevibacter sp.]|nr:hypothetical protein [Methanobrevibacter sp.]
MFKKIMILIIALVCLLSVSAISATDNNTAGDNVTVDNTDESFYVLQDEIANAYEKGTLELERNYINTGGFPDGITINNSITIDGKGHTIDGKNNGRIFNINTNVVNVTLKNINFVNGKVTSEYSQMLYGGAIFVVKSGSSLTVINSTFTNTTAQYSGGAISSAGKVTVINSTFTNTRAEYDGGAIYCYGGVNVTNSSFTNTTSVGYGGAIYNTNRGSVTLTNSSFTNTSSGSYGGAIYCITATVTNSSFTNTTVINTGASRGGAILSYMDATVVDSKFKDCKAKIGSDISSMSGSINLICNDYDGKNKYNNTEVNGNVNKYIISGTFAEVEYRINQTEDKGVLNLENKKYTAIDNDTTINVNKNITINGQGATLDADKRFRIMNIVNGMSVTLKNINFINGNSSTSGGAIYSISDSLTVTNSSFTNNTAAIYGGAIFTYYEISVTNSSFTNNTANSGYGGAIGSYRSNITVTNSNFTNNRANSGYGGAIGSYGGNITMANSNFTNNIAYCGGTICKASIGSVTVTNSNFINTTSFTEGGAICSEGNVSVINSTFTNTKANNVGGAIIGYSSSVSVINSTFTNTTSGSDGGAISNYPGNIFVSNSNFINNSAKGNGGSIRAEGSLNVKDSTFNSP